MPSNEPATTRRPSGPTLRGALLWAVAGAALFLGVGAALPVWWTTTIRCGRPAPLWRAILDRAKWDLAAQEHLAAGRLARVPGYEDLTNGPLALLACGAVAGGLGYVAWGAATWHRRKEVGRDGRGVG